MKDKYMSETCKSDRRENAYKVLFRKPYEKIHLEDGIYMAGYF
jgi:hypothetical protein